MIVIALALALQGVSSEKAGPYPIDQDCSEYEDGSTVAMVECLSEQHVVWDRRLNDEYKAALERADASQLGPLRTAQRIWLQYQDANCEMYGAVEGTISRILAARCWRDMTRERTLELREMNWSG